MSGMLLPSTAPLVAWPSLVGVWGPGGASAPHTHHAMHLIVALSGELRLSGRPCAGGFVPAEVRHDVDARGVEVLTVFAEPESAEGAALSAAAGPGETILTAAERDRLVPLAVRQSPTPEAVSVWLRALAAPAGRPPMHPRVRRVLRDLRAGPLDRERTSAAALAASAGLSESRFLHVFRESTGTPLRRYLMWLRLQRAAPLIMSRATLTEAAFAAGFSDAAHMTRTFKRLFGVTPSVLVQQQAHAHSTRA